MIANYIADKDNFILFYNLPENFKIQVYRRHLKTLDFQSKELYLTFNLKVQFSGSPICIEIN